MWYMVSVSKRRPLSLAATIMMTSRSHICPSDQGVTSAMRCPEAQIHNEYVSSRPQETSDGIDKMRDLPSSVKLHMNSSFQKGKLFFRPPQGVWSVKL